MIILVLGSLGFTGRNLCKHLRQKKGIEVVGVDRLPDPEKMNYMCDLNDSVSIKTILTKVKPDQIYNVAGSITNDYNECYASNVTISKNLLDVMESMKLSARILLVGSSAEYGLVKAENLPVKETQALNPVSIYGLTKVYQTFLMRTYKNLYDLDIVMVRPFNLIGEGMSENLFPGKLEISIRDFKIGKIKRIETGSLNARRDYIHIDDALIYYQLAMDKGTAGETYNVGSGKSILLRDLLRDVLDKEKLDMSVVDEMPVREKNKLDVSDIYADISKVKALF